MLYLLLILLLIVILTINITGSGIIKKKITFKDFCFPKSYKLQSSQKFLGSFFTPEKIKKRGKNTLLVFHKIGSGKTCTSIQIAKNFIFKNSKPLFIMPASLIPNFLDEVKTPCGTELRDFHITSYNGLLTKKFKDISIIIIDEFQNIINQKGTFFNIIIKLIESNPEIPVVILSGTPIFDNPGEFKSILRLLRIPNENYNFPEDLEKKSLISEFKKRVSYYGGAPSFTFPKIKSNIISCRMSPFQSKWYIAEVEAEERKNIVKMREVSNDFYIKSRQKANITFGPNVNVSIKKLSDNLEKYSAKFYHLFKKLKKKRLAFIYTNFTGKYGIETLVKLLEYRSYKNFHKHGPGADTFAVWSGNETQTQKKNIKTVFNSPANNNGSKLRVIIGSSAIKEGVSFYRMEEVHILDMYWNYSRLEQIYGRAIRYCSHKTVPHHLRKVELNLYTSISNSNTSRVQKSVDKVMLEMAEKKKEANKIYINFLIKKSI